MFTKVKKFSDCLQGAALASALIALLAVALPAGSAQAMNWCGENGIIRFSFVESDPTANVHHAKVENGVTKITLVAWLTDVEALTVNGVPFDHVGAFEFNLEIKGAEAFILSQKVAGNGVNISQDKKSFVAGMAVGLPFVDGKTALGQWEIMFQGEVKDVKFGLGSTEMRSCLRSPGCPESETRAIYIGIPDGGMLDQIFGAGYENAWLNPSTEPETKPVMGKSSWSDFPFCQKIEEK